MDFSALKKLDWVGIKITRKGEGYYWCAMGQRYAPDDASGISIPLSDTLDYVVPVWENKPDKKTIKLLFPPIDFKIKRYGFDIWDEPIKDRYVLRVWTDYNSLQAPPTDTVPCLDCGWFCFQSCFRIKSNKLYKPDIIL